MRRRVALRYMVAAVGGLMVVPSCLNRDSKAGPGEQGLLLADIAETMIPTTDTPGARELGIGLFVQMMIRDCYDKETQEGLTKYLSAIENSARNEFRNDFAACTHVQRISILKGKEESEQKEIQASALLVKKLVIQKYLRSEYVMTNITNYSTIPASPIYHCVTV